MQEYYFITYLQVNSSREQVWELIKDLRRWPQWWHGVLEVREISKGRDDDRGTCFAHTWRSFLPYKLKFATEITGIEEYKSMEANVTGELVGTGRWEFADSANNSTAVEYHWRVRTNVKWMNLAAPFLSRIFRWNHDTVMRWGGEGIAKKLNSKVIFRSEWIH